ncbi:hypothetical protein N431DRAFT_521247 [Stipitochalara longipes BDJ]|nr:hypothetical protein N431DRAFT_521247 [Stipitochalara longipes BDJ]
MAEPNEEPTISVPTDLLQSLLTEIKQLRQETKDTKTLLTEIKQLREENKETKNLLSTLQNKLDTIPSANPSDERGAFECFPKLPIEMRHKIWDIALSIPRVAGAMIVVRDSGDAKEALAPLTPNSTILLVSQESRSRAKRILVKCTEDAARSQDRLPMLYLHPVLDTFWVTNYTWARGRNSRITDVVFGPLRFSKLAVPSKFWVDMMGSPMNSQNQNQIIEFVLGCHTKGVEELILVVGDGDAAKCSDAVLIEPRQLPEDYMKADWCREVKANYPPSSPRPTNDLLPWSSCNKWAIAVLGVVISGYVTKHKLKQKFEPSGWDDLNERETIIVELARGISKLPVIKFLEATTRKELCRQKSPF